MNWNSQLCRRENISLENEMINKPDYFTDIYFVSYLAPEDSSIDAIRSSL